MNTVTLTRLTDTGKETLGNLSFSGGAGKPVNYFTLELPWKDNANQVSCIPKGTYTCAYTQSTRMTKEQGHPVFTYEILNVPGRGGIRIHSANYFHQLLGCIALGTTQADIDGDGQKDVGNSRNCIAAFETAMNKQNFQLVIV